MFYFNKMVSVMMLVFGLLSFNAFSAVTNCVPSVGGRLYSRTFTLIL